MLKVLESSDTFDILSNSFMGEVIQSYGLNIIYLLITPKFISLVQTSPLHSTQLYIHLDV